MSGRQISEFVGHSVLVAGSKDAHGNIGESWATAINVGIFAFDPGSSSEPHAMGQNRLIMEPTLYLPTSVIFGHRDRVTARGVLYEVEGITRQWPKGNVVSLKAVSG